jgi:hypothetical protein
MTNVAVNDIIQIANDRSVNQAFNETLAVVYEVKAWGVLAYVRAPTPDNPEGGLYYVRLAWGTFRATGGKYEPMWMPPKGKSA